MALLTCLFLLVGTISYLNVADGFVPSHFTHSSSSAAAKAKATRRHHGLFSEVKSGVGRMNVPIKMLPTSSDGDGDGDGDGDDDDNDSEEELGSSFESLGLSVDLLRATEGSHWIEPTPIQRLVIPRILDFSKEKEDQSWRLIVDKGNDETEPNTLFYDCIWAEAPTGSGKTGAFALPLLQIALKARRDRIMSASAGHSGKVSTLILCPTRELALQIGQVFHDLVEFMPKRRTVDVFVIHGGVPMDPQIEALAERRRSGKVLDVLVATPGRLVDVLCHHNATTTSTTTAPTTTKDDDHSSTSPTKTPTESALERRLLNALDSMGRVDATLTLSQIQEMDLDREDDDGRASIVDVIDSVQYLVLDEADRLLGQAFKDEVNQVLKLLPRPPTPPHQSQTAPSTTMKTLLFSATFPEQIQPQVESVLARLSGHNRPPLRLSSSSSSPLLSEIETGSINSEMDDIHDVDSQMSSSLRKKLQKRNTAPSQMLQGPASTITLRTIRIEERDRTQALRHLLQQQQQQKWNRVLVFVATRYSTEHVSRKLRRAGIASSELHGKLDQNARLRRLRDLENGKIRVLVTTDLASRGLDVRGGLAAVVNYDLPRSAADFTHRIGRTGRAGMTGTAITFVTPSMEDHYNLIERRHFRATSGGSSSGAVMIEREVLEGFEPDEDLWRIQSMAAKASVLPGVLHSDRGLAHDKMHGGIKGRRKSKKDKLREAAARKEQSGSTRQL